MASQQPEISDPGISPAHGATTLKLRELSHDLSNALEIIIQTSFLLGTLDLGENGRQWHSMLDTGVQKATALNQQLREAIRPQG